MKNKPVWIRTRYPYNNKNIKKVKKIIYKNNLNSVCESAFCPNIFECFSKKIVTFMILGNICTRNCLFCKIKKGRTLAVDKKEPKNLANIVSKINLNHVVITSVTRDDLKDGGSTQFSKCIKEIRKIKKKIIIEILVPDFRSKSKIAIPIIEKSPPDIFAHNIETVPRLYSKIMPGSNYIRSLKLLKKFKIKNRKVFTKSSLILGLGETKDEIIEVMNDLKKSRVDILTLGQYLRPSKNQIEVDKYLSLEDFKFFKEKAIKIGFKSVNSGPFVRSSYMSNIEYKKIIYKLYDK
ncbi:MAG: lipoyl synthase [Enterobacteriaceae bacterium]